MISSGFHCSNYRVTDEAFLAETSKYGPSAFLRTCSLLFKDCTFVFLLFMTSVIDCRDQPVILGKSLFDDKTPSSKSSVVNITEERSRME